MMRLIAGLLSLILAIVGCASPTAPSAPKEPPAPARLLLVVANEKGVTLRPVDPLTLADLPGFQPLDFRHHFTHAFSPDGKTMAAITHPTGYIHRGDLRLVDLDTWKETVLRPDVGAGYISPFFSPDGTWLYWIAPAAGSRPGEAPNDYSILRYAREGGQVKEVVKFPTGFLPREARLVGGKLAVYGVPLASLKRMDEAPHVMMVDLGAERVVDVQLDGISAGSRQTAETQFEFASPGLAWDVQGQKLYVAASDGGRVAVVDLNRGTVSKEGAMGRLSRWLVPRAEAKVALGVSQRALVSRDGVRLYLFGERAEPGPVWTPLPIRVVRTPDLTEVSWLELPGSDLALSPDGRHLLVAGDRYEVTGRTLQSVQGERRGAGLAVVDTESLKVVSSMGPESHFWLAGFSLDSRSAYVREVVNPGREGRVVLRRFDLKAHRFVAERQIDGYGGELIGGLAER